MSSGILTFIYILVVLAIMLPGIVAAVIIGFRAGVLAGLGILAAWEFLAALACFWFSRKILHCCDIPVVKIKI